MRAADRVYLTAHAFRRFLQRALPAHLRALPAEEPLARARLPRFPGLPAAVARRWPAASPALLAGEARALGALPIDHRVGPAPCRGGAEEGRRILERFVEERLDGYEAARNHPDADGTSGLSPYLHFGHVGVHEVLARLAARAGWTPDDVAARATGSRTGWWRLGGADGFLDQLVTWRELGFNFCWQRPDHARYESLPGWARATLARHAGDPRDRVYTRAELEAAVTHDPLWNAAQRQLRREGRLHTYLRMLWGKKILEWSRSPGEALDVMVELNDRYAVDGRDPNSCTGIFWVLGRYDRPWFPERPVFGQVRYMSSANTARKVRVREYLRRHAP
jgi:deoxyribodipyrimidine photo-lyase